MSRILDAKYKKYDLNKVMNEKYHYLSAEYCEKSISDK